MVEPRRETASPREFAGVWAHSVCSWCGSPLVALGVYLDFVTGQVVIRPACEKHIEDLVALIDGLTDGRLIATHSVPKEKLN